MQTFEFSSDIEVLCVKAESFPDGILPAFQQLESKLSSVNDRTFYGISMGSASGSITYLAAACQLIPDESKETGLATFMIRKGTYLCVPVKDFMNDILQVGEIFKELLQHPALDTTSYCLELYQGRDVLCMVKTDPSKLSV